MSVAAASMLKRGTPAPPHGGCPEYGCASTAHSLPRVAGVPPELTHIAVTAALCTQKLRVQFAHGLHPRSVASFPMTSTKTPGRILQH
jgi:hypothetical protein